MGTTTGQMTERDAEDYRDVHSATADEAADRTDEIRGEIEHTRSEMSETIDELQEKLNPQHIKEQVKDTVREATIGRAEDMASNAGETAREAGHSVMERIKENPVAAAMVGIGLGWLFMNNSGKGPAHGYKASSPYGGSSATHRASNKAANFVGSAQDKAADMVGDVQGKAVDMAEHTQDQAHRAIEQSQQVLEESPLVAGAVALALGAAVGFTLPETRRENKLMGETRDKMLGQASEIAHDAVEKVEHVAAQATHAATDAARQEAQEQGLAHPLPPQ